MQTTAASRQIPLVVIATAAIGTATAEAARLRQAGCVVYEVHGLNGCLRAAALSPDEVLLDPALSPRVERLLRAHPGTASARIALLNSGPIPQPLAARLPVAA